MARTTLLAVTAVLMSAPLGAQMVPGPLRDTYPAPLTAVALANADSLRLTAVQRRTLEARQARLDSVVNPLRSQIAGLREGRDVRSLPQTDRHAVMVAARTMREAVLANIDSANTDVRAALTPDQAGRLDSLAAAAGGGRGARAGCPCGRMQGADSGGMMRRGGGMGGSSAGGGPHRHGR